MSSLGSRAQKKKFSQHFAHFFEFKEPSRDAVCSLVIFDLFIYFLFFYFFVIVVGSTVQATPEIQTEFVVRWILMDAHISSGTVKLYHSSRVYVLLGVRFIWEGLR